MKEASSGNTQRLEDLTFASSLMQRQVLPWKDHFSLIQMTDVPVKKADAPADVHQLLQAPGLAIWTQAVVT